MEHTKHDFTVYKKKTSQNRTPIGEQSYKRFPSRNSAVNYDFTLDDIEEIIKQGDPQQLRELSRYYYRTSGVYRNVIDLRANLYLYLTMVSPVYDINKKISKEKILKSYNRACAFVDKLNVPLTFAEVSRKILLTGIYYGILRENAEGLALQELPLQFCRSRFKDEHGFPIVEFNLNYFNNISDDELREEAVASFPKIVELSWRKYSKGRLADYWIEIPPMLGGCCFTVGDKTPPFVASIPSIYKMEEAVKREARRDENELYKLLVQTMPIDKDGELVFSMDEIGELHEAVSNMIRDVDTLDVLTTLGKVNLESIQDTGTATAAANKITKYADNVFNSLGVSSNLFNSEGSAAIPYSVKKEEAIVSYLINQYSAWIGHQVNRRFKQSSFSFQFEILPITVYNREEMRSKYFQGAQYGYSKLYAGVALGIKQSEQMSLVSFENDILDMTSKMIPLQSSYTSTGSEIVDKEKNEKVEEKSGNKRDVRNNKIEERKNGRPQKTLETQAEQTVSNIEGQ